jgi:uncharacterized protein DUF6627
MSCFPRPLRFVTALFLLLLMTGIEVGPAAAGLAPSRLSGVTEIASQRDADMLAVQRALEHKLVAQKLRDYGVEPDAARARLASLNDAELHQLATASAGLPSGGDGLGALVTILIVVILVIVILKLLNKEIIVR